MFDTGRTGTHTFQDMGPRVLQWRRFGFIPHTVRQFTLEFLVT